MIQVCKLCGWPFDTSGDPRDVFCGDCTAPPSAEDDVDGPLVVAARAETKEGTEDDGD